MTALRVIRGSYGTLHLDSMGRVTSYERDGPPEAADYSDIFAVDVADYIYWARHSSIPEFANDIETDILLVGFWYWDDEGEQQYEEASDEAREIALGERDV